MENNKFEIPGDIRALIDYDFLKMLQNELYMIFNLSLEDYEYDNSALDGENSGWDVAFCLTCVKSNKKRVYEYYRTLSWEDSELFDGFIVDMMVENKIVLPKSKIGYLSEALCLPQEKIGQCLICGKHFLKSQLVWSVDHGIENWTDSKCNSCDIKEKYPEQSQNANEYYRSGISIVRKEFGVE